MKHAIALAAITFFAGAAQADGLYVSAAGGLVKADLDCSDTITCDTSGTAIRAALGWKINPMLSVEGLYLKLGKATASFNDSDLGRVDVSLKTSLIGATAVFHLPLNPKLDLNLRLGGGQVKSELSGGALGVRVSLPSEDGFQLLAGLGMSYAITPQLSLEGQWEATKSESQGEEFNLSAFTVGVRWKF